VSSDGPEVGEPDHTRSGEQDVRHGDVAMGDAVCVEMTHSSHSIEQHLVLAATSLEVMMLAWIVNPNELPESSAATLHRYVEVGLLLELACKHTFHPNEVRMRK